MTNIHVTDSTDKPRKTTTKPSAEAPSPLTKAAMVLQLLQQTNGATLAELKDATGWQAHSIRGFLSGTVRKRMGHTVLLQNTADGDRRYVIAKV